MKSFITKFLIPILSVATSGLLFQQYYLIQSSWESYYTWTTSNWLLYILCFISYYKCIFIKHSLPSHLPAPRHKHQIRHNHQLYTQVSFCDKQNRKYKPTRTSHCKINGCVARFDHYCPYINNPLCLRNLKAFFLFVGYGGFFALQFLILSIYNYVLMTRTGINPLSEGEVLGWVLLTICSFILTLGMVGLFFGNLYFVSKNITQIDMMKGRFKTNDKQGTHPNPFDLGLISNFSTIFEGQLWTFWWPSQLISRYDGTKFPMIPAVSSEDKKELFANVQEMLRDPIQKSIPSTIQQLFQKEKDNHKNTIFFFLGEQYKLKQKIQLQEQQQNISQTLSNKKSSKQASEIQQQQKILEGVYDQ